MARYLHARKTAEAGNTNMAIQMALENITSGVPDRMYGRVKSLRLYVYLTALSKKYDSAVKRLGQALPRSDAMNSTPQSEVELWAQICALKLSAMYLDHSEQIRRARTVRKKVESSDVSYLDQWVVQLPLALAERNFEKALEIYWDKASEAPLFLDMTRYFPYLEEFWNQPGMQEERKRRLELRNKNRKRVREVLEEYGVYDGTFEAAQNAQLTTGALFMHRKFSGPPPSRELRTHLSR